MTAVTDNTFSALSHERELDQRVKIVRMARNFGKEAALSCGLHIATGRAAITMDSDLQHPTGNNFPKWSKNGMRAPSWFTPFAATA